MRNRAPVLLVLGAAAAGAGVLLGKHGHFPFEEWPAFHAVYGFLAACAAVALARLLRPLLKRREEEE